MQGHFLITPFREVIMMHQKAYSNAASFKEYSITFDGSLPHAFLCVGL
jgi:hypothetical protein